MLIILDSSILCSNFHMTGPSFEIMNKIGIIVIPEIVYDEVCNKYHEHLIKLKESLDKTVNDINKMTKRGIALPFDNSSVAEEYQKYVSFLDMFIIESGMTIPEPYPDIEHKDIVARALQRKKPFKSDGSTGYRDYLLWCTCLNIIRQNSSEEIHFITNNTKDFSDSSKPEELHPDLQSDLANLGIQDSRFYYWSSLNGFIDQYASSVSRKIDDVEKIKETILGNSEGFINPVHEFINNVCLGKSLQEHDVYTPGYDLLLFEIEDIASLQIDEVISMEDDYLLEIRADCIGIVESRIANTEMQDLGGVENEFDFEIVQKGNVESIIHTRMGLQLCFRALYDKANNKLKSIEVTDIEDYYCPYCP